MFFVVIILFFLLLISNFLSKFELGRAINFILTLVLLYTIFLFITYTPDREYYTVWVDIPDLSIDKEPTFQIIASYMRANNYDYEFLHISFLSVYCLIYLFFVSPLFYQFDSIYYKSQRSFYLFP